MESDNTPSQAACMTCLHIKMKVAVIVTIYTDTIYVEETVKINKEPPPPPDI